jgi:hypothetical protein
MPNTYVALRTETVATAANSVTFSLSGISGYTDLVLVSSAQGASGSPQNLLFQLNGDNGTGSLYSSTWLTGNGSAASSSRLADRTGGYLDIAGYAPIGTSFNTVLTHFNNYSNSTTNKTIISRANSAATGTDAVVSLWRNTAAITSIKIYFASNNIAVGSTFSLYGIANADQGAAKATGGIITEDSQYWYHTFGASGTFTPKQALTCDYLVVAGGGSGGSGTGGVGAGGGGAGGFRTVTAAALTVQNYAVTVGAGGPSVNTLSTQGNNGNNSVFNSTTSTGGGGGGTYGNPDGTAGNAGGSGGGGGTSGGGGSPAGGAASPAGQGNAGGAGGTGSGAPFRGGGGGGSSAAGATASASGNGGAGTASSINGFSVTYAGGGGAGGNPVGGAGGAGGGGAGANTGSQNATAGTVNTGGGGGGANGGAPVGVTGAGGSGIVIVRYAK